MTSQSIIEDFRKLPTEKKVRLAQALWDDVAEEAAHLPLSEAHRQLLDERLAQHEAQPEDVEPREKVCDDILDGR